MIRHLFRDMGQTVELVKLPSGGGWAGVLWYSGMYVSGEQDVAEKAVSSIRVVVSGPCLQSSQAKRNSLDAV